MAERGGRGLPSYNRTPTSQRFSPLDQINTKNVGKSFRRVRIPYPCRPCSLRRHCRRLVRTVTIKTDEGLRSVAVTSSRNGLVIVHLGGVR
jgi:hypothetical protein